MPAPIYCGELLVGPPIALIRTFLTDGLGARTLTATGPLPGSVYLPYLILDSTGCQGVRLSNALLL